MGGWSTSWSLMVPSASACIFTWRLLCVLILLLIQRSFSVHQLTRPAFCVALYLLWLFVSVLSDCFWLLFRLLCCLAPRWGVPRDVACELFLSDLWFQLSHARDMHSLFLVLSHARDSHSLSLALTFLSLPSQMLLSTLSWSQYSPPFSRPWKLQVHRFILSGFQLHQ